MTTLEELQARHRKEQRDLQGKITSKKKNATKKSRKGVNDECDRLERDLQEKQSAEIAALTSIGVEKNIAELDLTDPSGSIDKPDVEHKAASDADGSAEIVTPSIQSNGEDTGLQDKSRKLNRQKARLARRAAEQEAQIEAAKLEAANMPDQREQELSGMKEQMTKRGLIEVQIRPDGHCLYSAVAETVPTDSVKSYKEVRLAAADYMSNHGDDFSPFLEEPLSSYTRKIKDTAEWGGHLELLALAKAFDVNINVLQASGHVEKIDPGSKSEKEIWLAYYRHSFGLGEHYNALQKVASG